MFLIQSPFVKIWISTIKIGLVVISSPTCVLGWFGFKHTHMHRYENLGTLSLINDAKVYKIKMYLCSVFTTFHRILSIILLGIGETRYHMRST
jgi:Na+-driven multidrug efflux pump